MDRFMEKVTRVTALFLLLALSGLLGLPSVGGAGQNVYYEPTIKRIIRNDCGRCHSGPTRNLMDYDSLKSYAQSGLLAGMVRGPMKRFAGNDAQTILDWADQGAMEKPGAKAAQTVKFTATPGANCPAPSPGGAGHQPVHQGRNQAVTSGITYSNTIKYILKQDCLKCHSGQFRNLTTYDNVKMYADNGLLTELVRLGGPMHRFAGPDARLIVQWVNEGAPQ